MTKYTSNDSHDLHFSPAESENIFFKLFPEGKRHGTELCIGDVSGNKGESLKYSTDKGCWKDFATGDSGQTILGLIQQAREVKGENLSLKQAYLYGCALIGRPPPSWADPAKEKGFSPPQPTQPLAKIPTGETWLVPAPANRPPRPPQTFTPKNQSTQWRLVEAFAFKNELGQVAYLETRYHHPTDLSDKGRPVKVTPRLCYHRTRKRWVFGGPDHSQFILYRVPELATAKRVVLVEGPKTAEAAQRLFPDWTATTWAGGLQTLNALPAVAWEPLRAMEEVCLALDHEPESEPAIVSIATRLYDQLHVKRVTRMKYPDSFPTSWDLADPCPPGYTPQGLLNARVEIDRFSDPTRFIHSSLTARELGAMEFPEEQWLVEGLFPRGESIMLSGQAGAGKTWFTWDLLLSVAMGRPFLGWDVPEQRSVALIDGEMRTSRLFKRLQVLIDKDQLPQNFYILTKERLATRENRATVNLASLDTQARIWEWLEDLEHKYGQPVQLIAFDNISSLTAGIDENSKQETDVVNHFFIELRHKGYDVLFCHHVGKSGQQRGTSSREDAVGTHLVMSKKVDAGPGMHSVVKGEKFRDEPPEPSRFDLELATDPNRAEGKILRRTAVGSPTGGPDPRIVQIVQVVAQRQGELGRLPIAERVKELHGPGKGYSVNMLRRRVEDAVKEGYLHCHDGKYSTTEEGLVLAGVSGPDLPL